MTKEFDKLKGDLNDETYKGFTIKFFKPYNNVVIGLTKKGDFYYETSDENKTFVLNRIKDAIDKLNKKPEITNPDGLESFWVKGSDKVISIRYDTDPQSPREWSNGSLLTLHHNRYDLPNELGLNSNNFDGWEDMKKSIKENNNVLMIRQISIYDHSGISLNVGNPTDRWDSGIVGFAVITKESWNEIMGNTPFSTSKGQKMIEQEIKDYNAYLNNEVYGFEIRKVDNFNVEDSVWGFFDSGFKSRSEFIEYILGEAGYKKSEVEEI